MTDHTKELAIAKDIARQAGVIMKKYFFADDQQIQRKADNSPVTVADKAVNRLVIEELNKNFDDGVIGEEESTAEYGMGRKWLCDPIDGTAAFIRGVPTAMFSLGLAVDGVPVLGVAYDPFLDLLYEGVKGEGSKCNGVPIQVSTTGLKDGYMVLASSISKLVKQPEMVEKLVSEGAFCSSFSGAVYKSCLVAKGKFVGYFEGSVGAHDLAAVQVIVQEAGGKVTGFDGRRLDFSKPFKGAIVSNGVVHDKLIEILNSS